MEDFRKNFKVNVPPHFNFGYDIIDGWAEVAPSKTALVWTGDNGSDKTLTYAEYKAESDKAASYLQSIAWRKV